MPPNIHTITRGSTLTVKVSGPLDRRIASSLFSRFLSAKSRYDELIVDLAGVDEVHDAGLAALRLLRTRAPQAGKRLAVVGCHQEDGLRLRASGQPTKPPTHSGESPRGSFPCAPVACQPRVA